MSTAKVLMRNLSGKATAGEASRTLPPMRDGWSIFKVPSYFFRLFAGLVPGPSNFTVMLVIYLVAITAEAMSAPLAAGRRNMDIFGVVVIAFVTALGGGTIHRYMVLGHYPIGLDQHRYVSGHQLLVC